MKKLKKLTIKLEVETLTMGCIPKNIKINDKNKNIINDNTLILSDIPSFLSEYNI